MDIRKTPFRRTLQILTPLNKNEKQKNRHLSKNITDKHHYFNKRKEIKSDGSAIDEILEAVDEVLPTDKSIEMLPKGSNTFSRIF